MNFIQLKDFNAVCACGTVSRAAAELHIAQPSLSVAIKELENEFGAVLFKRTRKGMALTPEGQRLLSFSRDIIERADAAEKAMRELGHGKKSLKLGVPPMIGSFALPKIYGDFLKENPDVEIEIVECGKKEMLAFLAEGELDMAFISYDGEGDDSLSLFPVGTLELVCAFSEKKSVGAAPLSPKDLDKVPLVLFKDGFFQSHEIKCWFSEAGVSPSVLMKTDQLSTLTRVISAGIAVGFLFRPLAESEKSLSYAPLFPAVTLKVGLVWQKDKYLSTAMQRLKAFLEEYSLFD